MRGAIIQVGSFAVALQRIRAIRVTILEKVAVHGTFPYWQSCVRDGAVEDGCYTICPYFASGEVEGQCGWRCCGIDNIGREKMSRISAKAKVEVVRCQLVPRPAIRDRVVNILYERPGSHRGFTDDANRGKEDVREMASISLKDYRMRDYSFLVLSAAPVPR
jgi:hypothetical protein